MANTHPIHFPAQLRQHLRAQRKRHGFTQAQLGLLVGVSQARIAEIEANPGAVNFEQLMKLMAALDVTFFLRENSVLPPMVSEAEPTAYVEPPSPPQKKGSW